MTLQRITKLGDIHPPPLEQFELVRQEAVISVLMETFMADTDTEVRPNIANRDSALR